MITSASSKSLSLDFFIFLNFQHLTHHFYLLLSLLHNPHLGLSETFNRLYDDAKLMADCVVPQGKKPAPFTFVNLFNRNQILIAAKMYV